MAADHQVEVVRWKRQVSGIVDLNYGGSEPGQVTPGDLHVRLPRFRGRQNRRSDRDRGHYLTPAGLNVERRLGLGHTVREQLRVAPRWTPFGRPTVEPRKVPTLRGDG